MVYLAGFLSRREPGRRGGALPLAPTRSFAVRTLLRYVLGAAVTLLGALECGWGASPPQTAALERSSTTAAQEPSSSQQPRGQNSQTTPQNPSASKSALALPALTIPRLTRAPALEDFLRM